MSEIHVSCIMPTGDRQHLIRYAIESFFEQTVSDTELIIVDDGEFPTSILDNPRIRYFHVQKMTIGEKLNFACLHARGSIICRWDDDDWYASTRIARQLDELSKPGIQVTGFHSLHYYDMKTGGIWPMQVNHPLPHAMGTSLCFTKAYWQNNKFQALSRFEDTRFSDRAKSQGVLSSFDGKPYVVARKHGANISSFGPNPKTNKGEVPQEFLKRLGGQMDSNHIIQSFWSGKLTTMEKLCIRSFMANGHEFHLYTYGKLEGVQEGCIVKDANEIISEEKIKQLPCVQQSADFFRVAMLLKKGGWYVDMDSVCLRPYDFAAEYVWAGCDSDSTVLHNSAIKVPANSPIMRAWYDHINNKNAGQLAGLAFQEVGPELCAKLVIQFGLQRYIVPRYMFDPVHYDRAAQMVDPNVTWDLSKSYSVHLFHAAWRGQHEAHQRTDYGKLTGTDDKFPEGCLYEQLKRRYLRNPKISIVITTYNRANQLRKTFESFVTQPAYKDCEVIVIDDGTDAETPTLCKEYGVEYVHVGRAGVYRNPAQPINIGLRRAQGDIIILQNAECKHSNPNTIELLTSQVTDNNVVFALVIDLLENGEEYGITYCGKLAQRPFFFCGAMKRSWFVKLRGMDEDYPCGGYDDGDFADRLKHEGVKIVYSDVKVHHQWHPRPKYSDKAARQVYEQKTAAMAAGKITAVRNLGREWGALDPIEIPLTWIAPNVAPVVPAPKTPLSPKRPYKYGDNTLTVNWWDRHPRK